MKREKTETEEEKNEKKENKKGEKENNVNVLLKSGEGKRKT